MSNRLGPNRAGPFGILQTLADGIKFFFKEDLLPDRADKRVFILAPFLSLVPAFLVFSVIPIGGEFTDEQQGAVEIFGHDTWLQLADPPIGVLLILACSSIAVYGVMLAGWSSGSKYPLLGSVRASAQMVSYEAALGLSVVAVVLLAGSLSTHDIVMSQAGDGCGGSDPPLEPDRHRRRAVRDLPHRRHRRAQPTAVRPRGGRAGAGRRLPHRVQLDPLRAVLPRRVHEHRDDVGDHRHALPRRTGRPHLLRARLDLGPGVVPRQALRSSCSCSCGSGPRCRGSATTSSWTSAGRCSSRCRSAGCSCWPASTSPATETGTAGVVVAVGFAAIVVSLPAPHRGHAHRPGAAASWPTRRCSPDGLPRGVRRHVPEAVQGHRDRAHRHRART